MIQGRFEVLVVSHPDREGVYVEVWDGEEQMCDVRVDASGDLSVEMYPTASGASRILRHADLLRLLQDAGQKLSDREHS